jgi:hypothetical protein
MNSEEWVIAVLARRSRLAAHQVTPESRFMEDLRLDGDDAVDALLEISKECSMDVSGFDSTLYFRSEPTLLSLLPFLPSQKKRTESKQPLTVGELIEAARRGSLQSR